MAYTFAKDNSTDAELKRFAACFLNLKDFSQVDWTAAAFQFDSKVKPESFRTVTLRALKKAQTGGGVTPAAANGVEGDGVGEAKAGAKGKGGGRKLKPAAEAEVEAEGEEVVMEKGKGKKGKGKKGKGGVAKKGKKVKAEVEEESEEGVIKAEEGEDSS